MHFAISPFNNRLLNANLLVCSSQQDSKSSSSCTTRKKPDQQEVHFEKNQSMLGNG